jgi:uncharacterized membrane protein
MTFEPFSLTDTDPSREIPHSGMNFSHTVVNLLQFLPVAHFSTPRAFVSVAAALAGVIMFTQPAAADFRLCNNTGSRVGIAIGYKDSDGWTTEGWWNLAARSCETLLRGTLVARFYYIYALDYERGGEWSGQAFMCTRDKEFTVRGTENCLTRGYERTGFFEVDTGEQRSWTVQLTESSDQTTSRSPATAPSWLPLPPAPRTTPGTPGPLFPGSQNR